MLVSTASELFMSWGYWGIVAGLLSMVMVLFVCMEILYAHARKGLGEEGESIEGRTAEAPASRHAA
ncbi:MAG TPA: hypothetical protein VHF07_04355 [Nitrospiraceae bacterium]|nr:hypothetical protein [Nitrospiraceae bacterium]